MISGADAKNLTRKRFDHFAHRYVTSAVHARGEDLDRLVEISQAGSDWLVLDIATGGGHTALKFAPFVAEVIATDIAPRMLEGARALLRSKGIENVTFRLADAEDLPFRDEVFDLVTCRIAPHHFPDCPRFVRESARVLKAGRLLLVQDLALPEDEAAARYVDAFEQLRDPSHNRGYAEGEWEAMFQAAGLVVEHSEQLVKQHDFVPWAERQGCSLQVMERLMDMVEQAPEAVAAWMQPRDFGKPHATFVNHHILIAGRKA